MIKAPVKRCIVTDKITDADGLLIADCSDVGCASDVEMRINMHYELVSMLKDISLVDGGSECIKSKIARARELLERCK